MTLLQRIHGKKNRKKKTNKLDSVSFHQQWRTSEKNLNNSVLLLLFSWLLNPLQLFPDCLSLSLSYISACQPVCQTFPLTGYCLYFFPISRTYVRLCPQMFHIFHYQCIYFCLHVCYFLFFASPLIKISFSYNLFFLTGVLSFHYSLVFS